MTATGESAQRQDKESSQTGTRPPPPCPDHPGKLTFTITQRKSGKGERAALTQYQCGGDCQQQLAWHYQGMNIPHRTGNGQCLDNEVFEDLKEAAGQEHDERRISLYVLLSILAIMAAWIAALLTLNTTRELLTASGAAAAALGLAWTCPALKTAISEAKEKPEKPEEKGRIPPKRTNRTTRPPR